MLNGAMLAHAGGWDEIAMVAAPIAIFAGLLWMANRRAIREAAEREAARRRRRRREPNGSECVLDPSPTWPTIDAPNDRRPPTRSS